MVILFDCTVMLAYQNPALGSGTLACCTVVSLLATPLNVCLCVANRLAV
jgi:hypothetical protein